MTLARRLVGESLGTAFLLVAVVGSGIMAERLSGGNDAIALLANSLATGGALVALIVIFAPVSGAHFNPAVTVALAARGELKWADALPYVVAAYITSAYWFTSSTSFANPAVTVAPTFTNTFTGIGQGDVPGFLFAQGIAVAAAVPLFAWIFRERPKSSG